MTAGCGIALPAISDIPSSWLCGTCKWQVEVWVLPARLDQSNMVRERYGTPKYVISSGICMSQFHVVAELFFHSLTYARHAMALIIL